MDLTKKEIDFINKLISKHWLEYNNSHKDNKEDWEISLNLVKKLTIPVVSNSFFCGVDGGFCPMERKKDKRCLADFECINQVTK